ncbi:hypothetical protein J8273_8972 [Carpediemonas membranifera]|uniref:Uncharacterized protein n=1 Tax=Carpediemonas membranifera TaxID=201153 RepID=A0A8J6AZF2_9EUKA|nr:hypothetical protein J8273_8972 [Carpediemonas membranifera]|eukprot:KAG9389672.1 hypothetical protein J8273_8972 [Carpediemonas membranifera]
MEDRNEAALDGFASFTPMAVHDARTDPVAPTANVPSKPGKPTKPTLQKDELSTESAFCMMSTIKCHSCCQTESPALFLRRNMSLSTLNEMHAELQTIMGAGYVMAKQYENEQIAECINTAYHFHFGITLTDFTPKSRLSVHASLSALLTAPVIRFICPAGKIYLQKASQLLSEEMKRAPTLPRVLPPPPKGPFIHDLSKHLIWLIIMSANGRPALFSHKTHGTKLHDFHQARCSEWVLEPTWTMCKSFRAAEQYGRIQVSGRTLSVYFVASDNGVFLSMSLCDGYRRIACPRPRKWLVTPGGCILVTPQRGVFVGSRDCILKPRPIDLQFCPNIGPKITRFAPWRRDECFLMVSSGERIMIILTTVGPLVFATDRIIERLAKPFNGQRPLPNRFYELAGPPGFTPRTLQPHGPLMFCDDGSTRYITGLNTSGELGLGHRSPVVGFVALPPDRSRWELLAGGTFGLYYCKEQRALFLTGDLAQTIPTLVLKLALLPQKTQTRFAVQPLKVVYTYPVCGLVVRPTFLLLVMVTPTGPLTAFISQSQEFSTSIACSRLVQSGNNEAVYLKDKASGTWTRVRLSDRDATDNVTPPQSGKFIEVREVEVQPAGGGSRAGEGWGRGDGGGEGD